MVPDSTEKTDITHMSGEQSKINQNDSILSDIFDDIDIENKNCTLLPSRYKEPVLTQLEINFFKFVQDKGLPSKIMFAEDFPRWLEDLTYYLRYLGLPTVVSEMIDAIAKNRSIRFQPDEDMVIKQLIMASCDSSVVFRYGATAQQTLYDVINSLGLIKSANEVTDLMNEFAIDIRDPKVVSLRKLNVLEFICKISNFSLHHKIIVRNMIRKFPTNPSFYPLFSLVAELLAKNEKITVRQAIEEIYKMVDHMCIVKPLESTFDFTDSNNTINDNSFDERKTKDQRLMNKRFNRSNDSSRNKFKRNRFD